MSKRPNTSFPLLTPQTTLILITLVGLLLRLWGLGFGLPNESRPDELPITEAIMHDLLTPLMSSGDLSLNPNLLTYPSLFVYLGGLFTWIYYLIGNMLEWFTDWRSFLIIFAEDPSPQFLILRGISAVVGSLLIPLGAALAYTVFRSKVISLLTAFFIAICPLLVRNSHFGTVDILLTVLCTGALLCFIRYLDKPSSRRLTIAALCTGLAMGTKYPAGLLLLPFILCLYWKTQQQALQQRLTIGLKGLLMIGITAALTSPWHLIRWQEVLAYFQAMNEFQYGLNHYDLPPTQVGWIYYPQFALFYGMTGWICALSLFGLGWVAHQWQTLSKRSQQIHLLLLSFLLPWGLMLGPNVRVMSRFILPMVPFLLLYASFGLSQLCVHLQSIRTKSDSPKQQQILTTVLILLFSLQPLAHSIQFDLLLAQPDTRTLARNWILQNVPPGSPVATGPSSGRIILPKSYGQLAFRSGMLTPQFTGKKETLVFEALNPRDPQTMVTNAYDQFGFLKQLNVSIVCLVTGLPIASTPPETLSHYLKEAKLLMMFSPTEPPNQPLHHVQFEPIDAFYVPYAHMEEFVRPGPRIFIFQLPNNTPGQSKNNTPRPAK